MIDVQLNESLLRQVEVIEGPLPEDTNKTIDFDAKGSVHVMCRNQDGKLIKDIPVKPKIIIDNYKDEVSRDYADRHEELLKSAKAYNKRVAILTGCLIVLFILSIIVIGKVM